MASPILHIKDSYYFEVPKGLHPVRFTGKQQFVGRYETWLRLDPQFQQWEANRFYDEYARMHPSPAPKDELIGKYLSWKEEHSHAGKPFWRFLEESGDHDWFSQQSASAQFRSEWRSAIEKSSGHDALVAFRSDSSPEWTWSSQKLWSYSQHLSGKILIPQPFGRLRNLYEKEWGLCISRFMLIEVALALLLWAVFSWLARRVTTEERPRGAWWNLLEAFVLFVRDEVARPAIGHEPAALATAPSGHGGPSLAAAAEVTGHNVSAASAHQAAAHHASTADHPKSAHDSTHAPDHDAAHAAEHHHDPRFDADRFVPLLLTIFFFVLGCNLAGMLPWVGAPTGEWGTTSAIALVTFATGLICGFARFGVIGYFRNQVPPMELPLVMAVVLKPMIFLLEILGLLIKHSVLSIRLLANMFAGHVVLLLIIGLAFSLETAGSPYWSLAFFFSMMGSVLLSCLELFVAFLQAYIFTFLSAMFIGMAVHSH